MNSRTNINNQWLSDLAEEFPQSANQLGTLTDHLTKKQERLAALIRYCAAHPELDMMRMYTEYSAALDAVAMEPMNEEALEPSINETRDLSSRQRAGQTKRFRTRTRILHAASLLLGGVRSLAIDGVCDIAGVSEPTFYNHFRSRSQLVAAAYEHLIVQG